MIVMNEFLCSILLAFPDVCNIIFEVVVRLIFLDRVLVLALWQNESILVIMKINGKANQKKSVILWYRLRELTGG